VNVLCRCLVCSGSGIPSFFQCYIRLLAIHDPEIERSLSLPRLSLRGQAVLLKEYDRVEQVMADEGQVADSIE
jgi:hypothetical protein